MQARRFSNRRAHLPKLCSAKYVAENESKADWVQTLTATLLVTALLEGAILSHMILDGLAKVEARQIALSSLYREMNRDMAAALREYRELDILQANVPELKGKSECR